MRAPHRPINPFFPRHIERSGQKKTSLQVVGGWPYFTTLHDILRAGQVVATPLAVKRLQRVADAVGFPKDEIFLDEVAR